MPVIKTAGMSSQHTRTLGGPGLPLGADTRAGLGGRQGKGDTQAELEDIRPHLHRWTWKLQAMRGSLIHLII